MQINRTQLKWIAVITMVIDHIGVIFFPEAWWMRAIGRVSFPVFSYCLVEGFIHTSDRKRYFGRLMLLALLSEIPFDMAIYGTYYEPSHQNIFFTLAMGLLLLEIMERFATRPMNQMFALAGLVLCMVFLKASYGIGGLLIIFTFYLMLVRGQEKTAWMLFAVINICFFTGYLQAFALLCIFPIKLYNGTAGQKSGRFFYWIYPLHLLILWVIAKYMGIR